MDGSGQMIVWSVEGWSLTNGNLPDVMTPSNIISGPVAGLPTPPLMSGAAQTPTAFSNNPNAAAGYLTGAVARVAPGGTGTIASEKVLNHSVISPFFTGR